MSRGRPGMAKANAGSTARAKQAGEPCWHAIEAAQALAALDTQLAGLSEEEAAVRLERYGHNRLPERTRQGPLRIFARQFLSPLIYLLLVAGALSLVIGDRFDALFIFGVLLLNAAIGAFQEIRADASARALRSLVPHSARLRRAGAAREIAAEQIVPGDIVELESGMAVTADLRLVEASGLEVDESTFTGEALPVAKRAGDVLDPASAVAERVNMVHAGTYVLRGRGTGLAVRTGGRTELGRIDLSLAEARASGGAVPLVERMRVLARQIAIATLALILVISGLLAIEGQGWREIVLLAIALAVAAIPEGMPVAVTVALAAAARRMARRNVIIRALPAVEGLGACTLIASDKTGTLTANRLTVERAVLADGAEIARGEWLDDQPLLRAGQREALAALAEAAALCNEAQFQDEQQGAAGDAVDLALIDFARESGCDVAALLAGERLFRVPYEPALRYAAVEAERAQQRWLFVKGAPEAVLPMCRDERSEGPAPEALAETMAGGGYRVLALARVRIGPGEKRLRERFSGMEFLGFVGLADPLRHGVVEAVAECRAAGVAVAMVTGDHPATALAIARRLGMDVGSDRVVTGRELADMADRGAAIADKRIFARIDPAQKLEVVQVFRSQGHVVAVTGDGVNDGPALHAANIGIAMGRGGTDVARGAADLVLADDNFATIVAGIEEGRVVLANIRKIVMFMLSTGAAEILMFLVALALALPMPLTAVQLLWLNLVTNGVLDVTLGFGTGDGNELRRPPVRGLARLIDRATLILMLPGAVLMTGIAVWVLHDRLASGMAIAEARNHVLVLVVTFQVAFLLSIRNLEVPFWRWHPPENNWMFLGMAAAIALQAAAMSVPLLRDLLGTGPVEPGFAWLCGASALAVLLATEAAKTYRVHQQRSSDARRKG